MKKKKNDLFTGIIKEPDVKKRMNTRKIMSNNYHSPEIDLSEMSFKVDYDSIGGGETPEDSLELLALEEMILISIKGTPYENFNRPDLEKTDRLTKAVFNELWLFVKSRVREYPIVHVWSACCDIFSLDPHKFYSGLSNVYKEELQDALDSTTIEFKKRQIKKLF